MKKILISFSAMFVAGLLHAQATNTENYIQSRTYLEPVTTSSSTAKQIETVQYFDGLGRPKQVVNVKASPLGKDVVMHIEYDGFGRQVKDYLPVPQSNTLNGAIVPSPLANATQPSIYGSEKIYAEKILENSPLDRIQQQIQVGTDWSNKPVAFNYDANIAGEVKKFTATFNYTTFESTLNISNSYGTAQLYKNTVTDEDGNQTIEFKNGEGQTLLVRKVISATEKADTYYVYNNYNQLAYVIPPLAAEAVKNLTTGVFPAVTLNNLCYQYKYDGRNRLVEKKLPGKGWEYMVYDAADRLVLTQDANMRTSNKWLITKYDQFGRVAYTGFLIAGSRASMQSQAGAHIIVETRNSSGFAKNGMQIYYSNNYFFEMDALISVNYYDTYPTGTPTIPTSILNQAVLTQNAQSSNISTKSLPVSSYVKNIEDDNWTKNYTWYDTKGRAIGSHSINHLGGYTKTESELDFSGTPKLAVTRHKRLVTDTERVITETFTYDHQNRLLTHKHQVDSNPVEYLAQNEYNELSQLKTKKVGGITAATPLQTVDYAYNIRGWMTKINDPANLGSDLFGYKINYNTREGSETPNPDFPNLKVKPKYNGNIAEVVWKTSNSNDPLKRYGYSYDPLNRLLAGFYAEPVTGNPNNGNFDEYLTYDLNGNISNLKRKAVPVSGLTSTLVDNLDYQYTGNRLDRVIENALNDTGYEGGNNLIDYDDNGSMVNMKDKGINGIGYNYLNLPDSYAITQVNPFGISTNFSLSYLYRADGVKLRKTYSTGGGKGVPITNNITDYLDGFQYKYHEVTTCIWCRTEVAYEEQAFTKGGGFIDPTLPTIPEWILDFVSTSEGFYSFTENRYIYQYRDHLGNARISFAKNSAGALEITDANNYYPFGLNHIGGSKGLLGGYQNYKYNGKELQETGMYDYGARFYMPDLGRWGVVDPLAEMYTRYSPYNYTVNNPINFTDPDGRWVRGAGFWNNLTKSDARIHAEQWADQLGSGNYNVAVNKGGNGTWNVTSHTLRSSVKDTFNSDGLANTLYIPYSEGGGLGTAPSPNDAWGSTISSIPESRGKTDIQMQVSENPLVQGAALGLLTGGSGNIIRNALQPKNYVYRALTNANAESLAAGEGIYGKAANGSWTLEEHLIRGSSPKSFINDPWISTTTDLNIAKSFSSGNGIVRIDLSKMAPSAVIKNGSTILPRSSAGYHYSVWQQEVSILGRVPQNAMKIVK